MRNALEIIYQDENVLVVNKPNGLLMHRSKIAQDASTSVLKILRAQTGLHLYTVHRLDRKTSGLLIIALKPETQSFLNEQFRERKVSKCYRAIVRGYTESEGIIDYAIKNDKGIVKDAITLYRTVDRYDCPWPSGSHSSSRYSLVELYPETGRYHQLRMHMAHIFHPIIGDRPHGCNKQNRLWKELHGINTMLLHAIRLTVSLKPDTEPITFEAPVFPDFERSLELLQKNEKRDIAQ